MARAGTGGVNMMYRSVPPRPLSYTFSDVLQASLDSRVPGAGSTSKRARSKTAPVSANVAEEYAERFKSRPTTRPAVIDFDGFGVKMYTGTGGVRRSARHPGQFPVSGKGRSVPPISLQPRSPVPKAVPQSLTERGTAATTTATASLHLAPLAKGTQPNTSLSLKTKPYRHYPGGIPALSTPTSKPPSKTPDPASKRQEGKSAPSSVKSRAGKSSTATTQEKSTRSGLVMASRQSTGPNGVAWEDLSASKLTTMDAMAFTMSPQHGTDPLAFPDVLRSSSQDYGDISHLPRPKRILPRRDLPWVFRFKVKKEMNTLSKIMASKPGASVPASSMG